MSRGRAALTEKEERILIQAQLMGLSTSSMIKIGNRLKALEKEKNDIDNINDLISGHTWVKIGNDWIITSPDGYVFKFVNPFIESTTWYSFHVQFDVNISKPGSNFKSRTFKQKKVSIPRDLKKRLCPEKSKELYSCIFWIKQATWLIDKHYV